MFHPYNYFSWRSASVFKSHRWVILKYFNVMFTQLIWLIHCDLWRFVVMWSRTVFVKWHVKWLEKRQQQCYKVHRWLHDFKPPLYLVDFIHEPIQNTWVFSHVCLETFCSHPSSKLYFECCCLSWVFVNVVFYPRYSLILFSITGIPSQQQCIPCNINNIWHVKGQYNNTFNVS